MNLPSVLLFWVLFLVYQQVSASSSMDRHLYDAVRDNLYHIKELKKLIEEHVNRNNENIELKKKLIDNSHESIELKAKNQQIELLTKLNQDLRDHITKMYDLQNYTINKQKIDTEKAAKDQDDLKQQIQQLRKNEENYKKRMKQKSKSQSEIEENLKREIEELKNEVSSLKNDLPKPQTQTTKKTNLLESNFLELNQTEKNLTDCKKIILKNVCNAIESVGLDQFYTPCKEESQDGCWIAIYNRSEGMEDFNRTWADYRDGFGNIRGEFFIGLEKLYRLTNSQTYKMYVKTGYVNESYGFASYDSFIIGNQNTKYELQSLGEFKGTASNVMNYYLHLKFSTFDEDNDLSTNLNCAAKYGAWWHNDCDDIQINEKWKTDDEKGMVWFDTQVKSVQMFLRPKCQNY